MDGPMAVLGYPHRGMSRVKRLSVLMIGALMPILTACQETQPSVVPQTAAISAAPGQLTGKAALAPADSVPGAGEALTITYLSTNGVSGSGLVPVTGEVIYPSGPAPAGGWPIMAWEHGTVGIADECAPSRNPHSARDQAYLAEWLHRGFAIVATDYQGLGSEGTHPYLNARAEAYSVLDGIRAALSALPDLRNEVMVVGQSQGAAAAFAATAFAPDYAPALLIRGTVATGIPYMTPQIAASLLARAQKMAPKKGDNGEADPLVAYALLMGASQAGLDPSFEGSQAFTPRAMAAFHAASSICLPALLDMVKTEHLSQRNAFTPDMGKALAPVFRAMAFPTLRLKTPLFIGIGGKDRDVSPEGQLLLARDACKAGTVVQTHLYRAENHSGAVMASVPDSRIFTTAVMAGGNVVSSCAPVHH